MNKMHHQHYPRMSEDCNTPNYLLFQKNDDDDDDGLCSRLYWSYFFGCHFHQFNNPLSFIHHPSGSLFIRMLFVHHFSLSLSLSFTVWGIIIFLYIFLNKKLYFFIQDRIFEMWYLAGFVDVQYTNGIDRNNK